MRWWKMRSRENWFVEYQVEQVAEEVGVEARGEIVNVDIAVGASVIGRGRRGEVGEVEEERPDGEEERYEEDVDEEGEVADEKGSCGGAAAAFGGEFLHGQFL
ncbi:hypothetical protein IEQ34_017020 [Dendrobium chrysotoxum]|uniref:Uncharacterized protein n=1 Tax=Dendrobium chrysotoxum TaxID=161865 RepID=A0AAV7GFD2_DENCH|nr:hypothetical protein IEQ34_017020 [Dendrobium chrysotoxum]